MKKTITLLAVVLLLASCIDYNDASHEISAKVQLQMPAEFTQGSDFEGHTVVLNLRDVGHEVLFVLTSEGDDGTRIDICAIELAINFEKSAAQTISCPNDSNGPISF